MPRCQTHSICFGVEGGIGVTGEANLVSRIEDQMNSRLIPIKTKIRDPDATGPREPPSACCKLEHLQAGLTLTK
eukprot:1275084-Pyramimonas_sp.AAC.1